MWGGYHPPVVTSTCFKHTVFLGLRELELYVCHLLILLLNVRHILYKISILMIKVLDFLIKVQENVYI